MNPLFSIGITTYNRREMLKESLNSILRQTFQDFEVIVGNDYPQEKITPELLNVRDPRIRYVNNTTNLGEIMNMNSLLEISRGEYFTWLADDDLYSPVFLSSVFKSLQRYKFPLLVFTTYSTDRDLVECKDSWPKTENRVLTGKQFEHEYLSKSLKVLGCYGMFNTEYLKNLGGMEKLGHGFSPYSDNLLAIRSGTLDRLVYIDAPLVFFRTHENSISYSSPNLEAYQSAQEDLLSKCIEVLGQGPLGEDFRVNYYLLLKWCVGDFIWVMIRSGKINALKLGAYLFAMHKYTSMLGSYRFRLLSTIFRHVILLGKYYCSNTVKYFCFARSNKKHG